MTIFRAQYDTGLLAINEASYLQGPARGSSLSPPVSLSPRTVVFEALIDLRLHSFHAHAVPVRAASLIFFLGVLPLFCEVEDDLTLGIETVTGLRSNYIYRGFQLADATLEAQAETEITLSEDYSLGLAAWHVAESSGDFAETAFGFSFRRDFEDFSLTASLDYHFFSESLFEDGVDLGAKAQWFITDDWDVAAKAHYDFGAEGAYFAIEGGWSHPLTEDFFLAAESGVSAVSSYYERSGLNDFYGRLSLTYNINSFLSITPFAGYSLGIDSEANDEAFAGIWLAVSF